MIVLLISQLLPVAGYWMLSGTIFRTNLLMWAARKKKFLPHCRIPMLLARCISWASPLHFCIADHCRAFYERDCMLWLAQVVQEVATDLAWEEGKTVDWPCYTQLLRAIPDERGEQWSDCGATLVPLYEAKSIERRSSLRKVPSRGNSTGSLSDSTAVSHVNAGFTILQFCPWRIFENNPLSTACSCQGWMRSLFKLRACSRRLLPYHCGLPYIYISNMQ